MLRHPVTLETEACPAPFDATTRCGVATVPANWAKPGRRKLKIWYASIPAPSGTSRGVTVPFMGGPGEAISEVAERFLALVPALPDRDMLIVDVRGNGRSGRLGCPTLDSAKRIPAGREQVNAAARCAKEVGRRRDHYTTVASALDVEAMRRALELPKPSLLGVSYGTWVVQTYAALFPKRVQSAVIDGIVPFDLDPWGRTYTRAMQRVLRLRCERTQLCDPEKAGIRVRRVAARLAAQPVRFPNSTRLLTEGDFSGVSIFAIQDDLADYLTAIHRALDGDYEPLLALTEAKTELTPPKPLGGGTALSAVVASRNGRPTFAGGSPGCPPTRSGCSRNGVGSTPHGCRSTSASSTRSRGSRPSWVPVLMLNGDIDLQSPLESAKRAKKDWPKSVFVTIKDAPHVTLATSECALRTAVSFLQDPALPSARACDSEPAPN